MIGKKSTASKIIKHSTSIGTHFEEDHEHTFEAVKKFLGHVDGLVINLDEFFEENAHNPTIMF